jgi:hypothetical protein
VKVWLAIARLDGCPFRLPTGSTGVSLRACGELAFALLYAEGIGAPNPGSAVRPWVDAELRVRARWDSPRWFAGVDVGPLMPLTRPTFVFLQPRIVVYEVPAVGVVGSLGAGTHF